VTLPFDAAFQRKIVKLALIDDAFCTMAQRHVTAEMIESDSLRWCWRMIGFERQAKRTPTVAVLRDHVRKVEAVLQSRYAAMVDAIDQEPLREEQYIRHAMGEFVRRNLFVQVYEDSAKLYNTGRADQAIELMQTQADKIRQVSFDRKSRHWFYEDLDDRSRIAREYANNEYEHTFPTGIQGVDEVLDGGLTRGELGAWLADSKGGKSLFLIHLAGYCARALQRNVLLILFEGSYKQTSARLDAWHANVSYREAKRGQFEYDVFQKLQHEYRLLRQRLVIREMTENWGYSAADIRAELDDLRAQYGWVPDLLVADYGDLMRSQVKVYSEEEHQRNAFADLKTMTHQDRGYAIWTASQAQRPPKLRANKKSDAEGQTMKFGKFVLGPKDIADSYNKVRRVDFLGSINRDAEDVSNGEARLYCAVYRDNNADRLVRIKQDLDRMRFVDVMDPLNRPDNPQAVTDELERKRNKAANNTPVRPEDNVIPLPGTEGE
jgi:hypothetical protein